MPVQFDGDEVHYQNLEVEQDMDGWHVILTDDTGNVKVVLNLDKYSVSPTRRILCLVLFCCFLVFSFSRVPSLAIVLRFSLPHLLVSVI